jgi:hypothetical protein
MQPHQILHNGPPKRTPPVLLFLPLPTPNRNLQIIPLNPLIPLPSHHIEPRSHKQYSLQILNIYVCLQTLKNILTEVFEEDGLSRSVLSDEGYAAVQAGDFLQEALLPEADGKGEGGWQQVGETLAQGGGEEEVLSARVGDWRGGFMGDGGGLWVGGWDSKLLWDSLFGFFLMLIHHSLTVICHLTLRLALPHEPPHMPSLRVHIRNFIPHLFVVEIFGTGLELLPAFRGCGYELSMA